MEIGDFRRQIARAKRQGSARRNLYVILQRITSGAALSTRGGKERLGHLLTGLTHCGEERIFVCRRRTLIRSNPLATIAGVLAVVACLIILAGQVRAQQYDCSEETYRRARPKVESLFGAGVLRKDARSAASVLVLDNYWTQLTSTEKRRFADRLVCAMAGAGKSLAALTFRSLMTGKVLGEWAGGSLSVR
jgi:hypothetical protein